MMHVVSFLIYLSSACLREQKVLPAMVLSLGSLELWSEDIEGKGDFATKLPFLPVVTYFVTKLNIYIYILLGGATTK